MPSNSNNAKTDYFEPKFNNKFKKYNKNKKKKTNPVNKVVDSLGPVVKQLGNALANNNAYYAPRTKPRKTMKKKNVKISNGMPTDYRKIAKQFSSANESYAKALVVPERARNAKIPGLFPVPTNSLNKMVTVPFVVSASGVNGVGLNSGKAAIVFNPFFCNDSSSLTSWLLINNSSNLTLTTAENTTGYGAYNTSVPIPAGTFNAYRLVSCSFVIKPQMSLQTAQGTIAGGIMTQAGQLTGGYTYGTSGNFVFAGAYTISTNIDNAMYYHKANITELQCTRAVYFPFDPSFENFIPFNVTHSSTNTQNADEFYFVYYITGAPSGASFNIEITYNYEFEPNVGNYTADIATSYSGNEIVQNVTRSLAKNVDLVQQTGTEVDNIAAMEDCDFKESKNGSFFDGAMSFLGSHMGDIGSISSLLLQAI